MLANGLGAARRLAPRSGCEPSAAHPAGALHGDVQPEASIAPPPPADAERARPGALAGDSVARVDGVAAVGGVRRHASSPPSYGTPRYVLDEADLRARCRGFRDAFARRRRLLRRQGVPVHGGRALDRRGGPRRSTSAPAASSPSRCAAGFPAERIALHGNNKSVGRAAAARVDAGVGRIVVDSFDEIDRLAAIAASRGRPAAGAGPGHRRRRGAHPRVHRDRARGPEVRLLAAPAAPRSRRSAAILAAAVAASWSGCTRTSARRSSTPPASRWPRTGWSALLAAIRDEHGVELPELDLGGGLGIAYTPRTTRRRRRDRRAAARDRRARVRARRPRRAAARRRAGPGDRRPGDVHAVRGRHGQGRRLDGGSAPTSASTAA